MRGSAVFRTGIAPGGALAGPWVQNPLWTAARAVPSLDLRFADNKSLTDAVTGASLVTFTRASSGTFVGSDGVLRSAVTNLLLRSEEFDNASWVKVRASISANTITAPNGTLTADTGIEDTSSSTTHNPLIQDATIVANGTYTASLYVRAKERSRGAIWFSSPDSANYVSGEFNLNTGTIATVIAGTGSGASAAISNVGDGWFRVSITGSIGSSLTTGRLVLRMADANGSVVYTGNGTSGIYFWGAQLEQSATVGEYIPTTSAINSAPRFDHRITSSTTNLLLRSEEFNDASWAKDFTVATANQTTSPNGTVTADKVAEDTSTNFHAVSQYVTGFASGTVLTLSIYAKAAGRSLFRIQTDASGGTGAADFNLSTVTATSGTGIFTAGSIQAVGDGWYRCSVRCTTSTAGAIGLKVLLGTTTIGSYTGDGTSGLFLWGAQLEQSATVGPYVPTTTAAATSFGTESLGLLVEEARTNSITNNTMVGAVAGTPGTNPTGWIYATTSSNGLTISIVGTGVENGINYIDYRFNGTTVASPAGCAIGFVNAAAATGQTWTASMYWKLAAGTATGITSWQIGIIESTSAGAFVTGAFYSQTAPTSAALNTQRPTATRTLSGGATVGLVTYPFTISVAGNTAIDFTVRIGLPQLEQGAFATSPILTSTATVTRAADVASITGTNFGTTRTNLLVRSEEFEQSPWAFSGLLAFGSGSITNAITAPTGVLTADLITENTANSQHNINQTSTTTGAKRFSVFAKQGPGTRLLRLIDFNATDGAQGETYFNLSTGAVVSGPGTIQAFPNGWYRCSIQSTTTVTSTYFISIATSASAFTYTGDGTSGIYLWGAQLETGSAVTPYIQSPSVFTSRASSGTYIGGNGVLQTATTNLLLRSEEIGTSPWLTNGSGSVTYTANAAAAPTGAVTADRVTATADFAGPNQFISAVSGLNYALSFYIKAVTPGALDAIRMECFSGRFAQFNITTGAFSSVNPAITPSSIPVGGGWVRVQMLFAAPSTGSLAVAIYANTSSDFFLWGAQLEQSATVGEYIPTTSAINSAARYDHDPVSLIGKGLLVEEARTNSIRNNTMVGAVAGTPGTLPTNWSVFTTLTGLTRQIVGTGTEDGITYIDVRLNGTPNTAGSYFLQTETNTSVVASNGQTWTSSAYVRLAAGSLSGVSSVRLSTSNRDSLGNVIASGDTTFTPTSASLTTQRFVNIYTNASALTAFELLNFTFVLSGAAVDLTLRIGLPQLELGAFATSVIPTTTATVTRAADISTSVATSVFERSWYNQTEGTFYCSTFAPKGIVVYGTGDTFDNTQYVTVNASNNVTIRSGNADSAVLTAPVSTTGTTNIAHGYAANNFAAVSNGGTVSTDTSGAVPLAQVRLKLGSSAWTPSAGNDINGTIKRLVYWGQRLPNNVLQAITQ